MEYDKLEFETTFKNGDMIPVEYTGYGKNISPEFRIKNLSDKAKSLVIILEDLSHPIKNFTHWIAWNIKANSVIPKSVGNMDNVMQGIAYGFHKYAGAKPPKFQKHNYRYRLNKKLSRRMPYNNHNRKPRRTNVSPNKNGSRRA